MTEKNPNRSISGKRSSIDWEAVERDYRTTSLSLPQLAERHSVDKQTIFRRAKKFGWERDLTDPVRAATRAAIVTHAAIEALDKLRENPEETLTLAVRPDQKRLFGPSVCELAEQEIAESDRQAGEAMADTVRLAAATNISVILGHRRDLMDLRSIAHSMMAELAQASASPEQLAAFAEIAAIAKTGHIEDPDERARRSEKALEGFLKMVELPQRAGTLQKLADVVTRVITHERTAFGIDDDNNKGGGDMEAALRAALAED